MAADVDPTKELIVEEFKSCRVLIEKNIDIMEKNEVYALGAAGALFVFSISATSPYVAIASATTPFLIALIGWIRFLGLDNTIDITNEYLRTIEKIYSEIGWVSFFKTENERRGKILKKSSLAFWLVFKIVCLGFAAFMFINAPLPQTKIAPVQTEISN